MAKIPTITLRQPTVQKAAPPPPPKPPAVEANQIGFSADSSFEAARPSGPVALNSPPPPTRGDPTTGTVRRPGSNPDPSIGGGGSQVRPDRNGASAASAAESRQAIEESATVRDLLPVERARLDNVMNEAGPGGLHSLGNLVNSENGLKQLRSVDSSGKTLLENLDTLSRQEPHQSLLDKGVTRQEMLDDVLTDVARPDAITQGSAQTCTVASMQYQLARKSPAEYVRVMTGLSGPDATVRMQGGGALDLVQNGENLNQRVASEMVFQNSGMDYANGALPYDPNADSSLGRPGLFSGEQQTLLTHLFGETYAFKEAIDPATADGILQQLKNWDAGNQLSPVLLNMEINGANHAVAYEKTQDGCVYYRDPLGGRNDLRPPSEYDKTTGLWKVPEDEFKQELVAAYISHEPINGGGGVGPGTRVQKA